MNRNDVYKLIDGERDYQEKKWNINTTESGGFHSFEEWVVYIEDYLSEMKHILARQPSSQVEMQAADIMRKIAAMAVCSMEQHGAPAR